MSTKSVNYAYQYAVLNMEYGGLCLEMQDTTDYILRPDYVPIEDMDNIDYILKYYYPIPETVTSFADFQGRWYLDPDHTQEFVEGNAYIDANN